MAEILTLRVKHHRAIVMHIIRTQSAQHVQHAIHCPSRRTVGRRQVLPHSMIGAIKIRRAVNEKECGLLDIENLLCV